jgi:hypothetical protein
MITEIYYSPSYLQGAYNPIVWSVNSDKILETDFKYVFDVYIDGIYQTRLKQRPNPSGAGMIDVSTLVQGYLVEGPPNGPWTQGETTINPAVGHAYCDNGTLSVHVSLKVGEEYSVGGGGLIIYNGTTDSPGTPSYNLRSNSVNFGANLLPVHVWPSSVEYQLQQWGMSNQTQYSGAYGQNPINLKSYDWGNAYYVYGNLGWPLNYLSRTRMSPYGPTIYGIKTDAYAFDRMTLSYVNWTSYAPDDNLTTIYSFKFTFADEAGDIQASIDLPVSQVTGCGPRTICSTPIAAKQLDSKYDIIHVIAGPDQVAELIQYWDPSLVPYVPVPGHTLSIQGYMNALNDPLDCTSGDPITSKTVITVKEWCESNLYKRVRLSWLNDLGGRDYMNFTQFLEKELNTTNDSYTQEQINWSETTPVPVGVTDPSGYLMVQGGTKVYNKMANTQWTIQTDWLTQDQVNLLEGLAKSPQVLAYIHEEGNEFSDYSPYPVTITDTKYSVKNVRQNKLTQGEFTIALTIPQKLQNA